MSCNCKAGCNSGCGCRRTDMPCSPIGNCMGLTILQQCTGTDRRFEGLTRGRTDCWPLDRATAKLVVIVDVAVVEQTCPVPLSTAVWDLHATVKWQCQTFWKSDEEILWIIAAEVDANLTSCVFFKVFFKDLFIKTHFNAYVFHAPILMNVWMKLGNLPLLSKCPRKDFCRGNTRNQCNKFSCCWHQMFRDFGQSKVWSVFFLCKKNDN